MFNTNKLNLFLFFLNLFLFFFYIKKKGILDHYLYYVLEKLVF